MRIYIILFIVIASIAKQSFAQNDSVFTIIKADTIYFNITHSSCFGGYDENIAITIISKDSYKVIYKNHKNVENVIIQQQTLSAQEFDKFITTFRAEMDKKMDCMCTSHTTFVLKSKNGKIGFDDECCMSLDDLTPVFKLKKSLKIKE